MLAGAAVLVLLTLLTWPFLPADFPTGAIFLGVCALIVVAGVVAAVVYTRHIIRVIKIDGRYMTLTNVSGEFAIACRVQCKADEKERGEIGVGLTNEA